MISARKRAMALMLVGAFMFSAFAGLACQNCHPATVKSNNLPAPLLSTGTNTAILSGTETGTIYEGIWANGSFVEDGTFTGLSGGLNDYSYSFSKAVSWSGSYPGSTNSIYVKISANHLFTVSASKEGEYTSSFPTEYENGPDRI